MSGARFYNVFAEDAALGLRAMFWWFDESHEDWRLYVVSRYCDEHGQRATYLRLRKHLERAGLRDSLPLYRIVAARTDSTVVKSVKKGIGAFHRYDSAATAKPELRLFDVEMDLPTKSSSGKPIDIEFPTKALN